MNTKLKQMLKKSLRTAESSRNLGEIWINRAESIEDKETGEVRYINTTSNLESAKTDTSDAIYNVWHTCTEDGVEEFAQWVEEELLPSGLSILPDTQFISSNESAVRYMIANK
tara:strand:+ start:4149 stop:4487 length:339 start_codon:yes stop_codon:yes gene_type:complete